MAVLGLGSDEKVDRVAKGIGTVHEHSIEIGHTVIVSANIGSISLIKGERQYGLVIVGGVLAMLSLWLFGSYIPGLSLLAVIMLLGGIGLAAFGLLRPIEQFLSIGTSDGKRTNIVSTNDVFLKEIRSFLRDKIDLRTVATATINVSQSKFTVKVKEISGGIALAEKSMATGAHSTTYVQE